MTSLKLFTVTALLAISSFFANAQSNFRAAESEFFIEIPQRGRFTVSLGDETISSNTGRFRFFNVSYNRLPLVIEVNNQVVLRTEVFVKPAMRSIAVFSRNRVDIIKDLPLANSFLNNWDKCVEDKSNPNYPATQPFPNIYPMSAESFDRFLQTIKNSPFEKDKLSVIDIGAKNAAFTVNQVGSIIGLFSFSDAKLSVLKKLYPSVIDPENGFMIMDSFTFSSDKEKAKRIILAGNYTYQRLPRY